MTSYTAYNIIIAVFILPICYWLAGYKDRLRNIRLCARVAFLITLISYPWDFFAIQFGIWTYPLDPGPRLFNVPLNDLVFIWLGSYLTCCVLVAVNRWKTHGQRHSESEDPHE